MSQSTLQNEQALELAQQVDEVIDQLWAAGKVTVVLRLLLEDCLRLVGALPAELEAHAPELSSLAGLCEQGLALGTPELERELTPSHRDLLVRLVGARRRYLQRLRRAKPGSRPWRRPLVAVAALALVAAAVGFWLRNAPIVRVSGTYSDEFPARQAIDGLLRTEWLLPQQQTGWLQLEFARARSVRAVRLHNAENSFHHDRATQAYKVQALSRGRVVASATGRFPTIEANVGPVTVPLVARDVTELRIDIESFYGEGGGLAEVQVQ